jgi:hypothetical protein
MSRTHHHSSRWGKEHRWAGHPDRSRGHFTGSRIGEAPGWHVRLYDERPGRRGDVILIRRIILSEVDPEAACFERTGGRKPHSYYW